MKKITALLPALSIIFSFVACADSSSIIDVEKVDDEDNDAVEDTDEAKNTEETEEIEGTDEAENATETADTPAVEDTSEPDGTVGNVLIDNKYATAIITGHDYNELWGYTAKLFLINKSTKDIKFTAVDVTINGNVCDPLYATVVSSGKTANTTMNWSGAALKENCNITSITDIEEIKFTFLASYTDEWDTEPFASEVVILNP